MLSSSGQLKVMKLCKGKTIAQVQRRLDILECYMAQKQVELRCKLVGLKVGD